MFPQNDTFPFIQIFVPVVAFIIAILCCFSFCKALQRVRRDNLERQTQSLNTHERPSVYIIPMSGREELQRGHSYTVDRNGPPPSYHELELKPDFIPLGPPPSYLESTSSPPYEPPVSTPAQTHTLNVSEAL